MAIRATTASDTAMTNVSVSIPDSRPDGGAAYVGEAGDPLRDVMRCGPPPPFGRG